MSKKIKANLGMLVFVLIGSSLIGYAVSSWAMGIGIFFLSLALRPWR